MGTRAEAYAQQLEAANADLIGIVEGLSDEQWRAKTAPEGWPVGVVAHHVAVSHTPVAGLAVALANGQPPGGLTMETIDQGNAQHAREHAGCTKEETLQLLHANGAQAAGMLRSIGDDQLDRSDLVIGNPMTCAQSIEFISIGHTRQHTESIKQAIAG